MRRGSKASQELIEIIKMRLSEGVIVAARENADVLLLVQEWISKSFHGTELDNAMAWLRDQTDDRINIKLLIRFPGNPTADVEKALSSLGFEWSNLSKGWMGEGDPMLIQEKFGQHTATVIRC